MSDYPRGLIDVLAAEREQDRERAERAERDLDDWMEKAVHLAAKVVKVREFALTMGGASPLEYEIGQQLLGIVDGEEA